MSSNKEFITTQRIMIKGVIAEAGFETVAEKYRDRLTAVMIEAKELGQEELTAASLAMGLVGLEVAEWLD